MKILLYMPDGCGKMLNFIQMTTVKTYARFPFKEDLKDVSLFLKMHRTIFLLNHYGFEYIFHE